LPKDFLIISYLTCCFCQQRLYVIERLTAEGLFFHRSCFTCDSCGSALRPPSYTFDQHRGQWPSSLSSYLCPSPPPFRGGTLSSGTCGL
uniref:LIM zinc-binding domain-containing protein n=1 Tax=Oryzias latipes TaxID=8090 RepID=A0A3P9H1L1_ORYLA